MNWDRNRSSLFGPLYQLLHTRLHTILLCATRCSNHTFLYPLNIKKYIDLCLEFTQWPSFHIPLGQWIPKINWSLSVEIYSHLCPDCSTSYFETVISDSRLPTQRDIISTSTLSSPVRVLYDSITSHTSKSKTEHVITWIGYV